MNHWVKQSIKIAENPGYLDKLQMVYPISTDRGSVALSVGQKNIIGKLLKNDNKMALLRFLFELKRFPYDEPFAGFLRQHPVSLEQNPKTVGRICAKLSGMGLSEMVKGIERPKSASRRFGQSFRNWLALMVPSCRIEDTVSAKRPVSINDADSALAKYASKNLGYRRAKGLDFVILGKKLSVLGEAKFISTTGGTQDKSFREAVDFIRKYSSKHAHAIAIIDGVVWAPSVLKNHNSLYTREIKKLGDNHIIMSSLLLPEFVKKELQ